MNIHEYQAKALLAKVGLPVPSGIVIKDLSEVAKALEHFPQERVVVKAQVHAGGRGKAGGVKLVQGLKECEAAVLSMLHKNLVTYQTDAKGQPVNQVLLESITDIERELYLGAVVDRASRRVVFMASTEGGVDIEKVAATHPEKIVKVAVDPVVGISPYQARKVSIALKLNTTQSKTLDSLLVGLTTLFHTYDLSLIEINPLVVTRSGDLLCLDAKINIDDNAMYRQPALQNYYDPSQIDPREIKAHEWELNYVPLDGNIGCMVNGAGLAMATMDLIKLSGGEPANFLDVGGGATQERVQEAFKIILSDSKVKGVLVNIFGGTVRCGLIAEGIIQAVAQVGIHVPVVVRLEGNQAQKAKEILEKSGLNIIAAKDFTHAAQTIVAQVRGS